MSEAIIRGYRVDAAAGVIYGRRGRQITKPQSNGYIFVGGGGYGTYAAHRLIWESVHGQIPDGLQINHINGIKTDNRICNLELVTHSENGLHAYRLGLKAAPRGEKNSNCKLSEAVVLEIRKLYARGTLTKAAIARSYSIGESTVRHVVNRTRWAHVESAETIAGGQQ